jgi:hypothetical protein
MIKNSRKIRFGLWYDFRNPSRWRQSADRLYAETVDQIAWERTTDLTTSGSRSTISWMTVTFRRFCPWPLP